MVKNINTINMNYLQEKFIKAKKIFDEERSKEDGNESMIKIAKFVNYLGEHLLEINAGELTEIQFKLAGYKFYLSDYVADLERIYKTLDLQIKEMRAERWDDVSATIKAEKGKVSNKEQIENVLRLELHGINHEQILYETMHSKYKMRYNAISDIQTAIVQRLADLKKIIEQTKQI